MTQTAPSQDATAEFNALRSVLIRVAYRMLGSVADAEDVVQDAFVRWMAADRSHVRQPAAFLRRIVTRLCLDQIKSDRKRREAYLGTWLPDPVVDEVEDDDITLPLMLALERLSPLERAAFLLHDVFGVSYDEIAETLDRTPSSCRQLAARARAHVRDARPRYELKTQQGLEIAEAFFEASRSGDMAALEALLAGDVSLHADGGGRRTASPQPLLGIAAVMTLHEALAAPFRAGGSRLLRPARISGLPGFVSHEADGELQTTAFDIDDHGKIAAIYITRNPDKLAHLHPA